MGEELSASQMQVLAVLANGIIPADELDAGAASVNAAERLAQKIKMGVNSAVYLDGLTKAQAVAMERFGAGVEHLSPAQVHELVGELRTSLPAFFKQLRMDVCALYLSDERVWKLIGFPGPSIERGGYPDFDKPQSPAAISRQDAS